MHKNCEAAFVSHHLVDLRVMYGLHLIGKPVVDFLL